MNTDNLRQFSPSCDRNKDPILAVLQTALPESGTVLEVGCGTGQHAAYFAANLPDITWQPADRPGPSGNSLESARAWRNLALAQNSAKNLLPPIEFDLFDDFETTPPVPHADAIVCINVIHIAPAPATTRLFALGQQILPSAGTLLLYGPFRYADRPLEPSNQQFDLWLKNRDPLSGIRDFDFILQTAQNHGFSLTADHTMPANNHILIFTKS